MKTTKSLAMALAFAVVLGLFATIPPAEGMVARALDCPGCKCVEEYGYCACDFNECSPAAKKSARKKYTGWRQKDGCWYYYVEDKKFKGWLSEAASWYYLDTNPGSTMRTGWVLVGDIWYYFHPNGKMAAEEWVLWEGAWYYFKASGAMAEGESLPLGGKAYSFGASGACINP